VFEIGDYGWITYRRPAFYMTTSRAPYRELDAATTPGEGTLFASGVNRRSFVIALNRSRLRQSLRRTHPSRPANREPVPLALRVAGRRASLHTEQLHAMVRLVLDVELRRCAGLSPTWFVRTRLSGRPSADGERTNGRRTYVTEPATGESRRCAISMRTTQDSHSPYSESGSGDFQPLAVTTRRNE